MRIHDLRIGDRAVTLLEGPAGWGECSPYPAYPCDARAAMRAAEEASREGFPAPVRTTVPVNALVDGPDFDPVGLVGFPAVKVKVGGSGDVDLVARVRDAVGPTIELRVDANGRWDVDTAIRRLEQLARYDVALAEQPVSTLEDLARVRRRTSVPIAADESVRSVGDARRVRALDAADVVVLKVQPLGGVRAALDVAEAAGLPVVVSSMMETSVGLAAGLALACALPSVEFACGLATAGALGGDVTDDPLVAVDGELALRQVAPDPALLERYRVGPRSSQAVIS